MTTFDQHLPATALGETRGTAAPGPIRVVVVRHGQRPLGAYVLRAGDVRYLPAVDVNRLAATGLATAVLTVAITVLGRRLRRPPMIGSVTMGPGGWISIKRAGAPPLRDGTPRPWWAHLLGAHRLTVRR